VNYTGESQLTTGGATSAQIYEPISLGYSCEVKYQLSRALFSRKYPEASDFELRRMLLTPEYGQQNFERHIFDWQITPFPAVLEYLERDFEGVFERDDLRIEDGEVVHRRLMTRHPHDFGRREGPLDDAAIDAGYANARAKFDHLAAKFLAHLGRPGPFLYVFKDIRIYDEAVRLSALLRKHNRDHAFKLLFIGYEGEDQMLAALENDVFKGWIPHASGKPAGREWEGHDASWDRILAGWRLAVHGGDRITASIDDIQTEPPPPVGRGWFDSFRRLFRASG
jgi:hypothetical protein